MIDWWYVAVSALWILGLSIILAAFSYHDWLRRESGRRWREITPLHSWRFPSSGGMLLFCLGMGLGREVVWWERTLWGALAVSFAWQTATAAIEMRRRSQRVHAEETAARPETATAASRTERSAGDAVDRADSGQGAR